MHHLTFDDLIQASHRLSGIAYQTPLLNFQALDEAVGGRIYLKAEIFQRTGSFKFRGAFNKITTIRNKRPIQAVVACSSGNHAQGVAAAAALYDIPATIVMPKDAPAVKLKRTRALGADVVLYDRMKDDRQIIATDIADSLKAEFIPPYDDFDIIAGQGTAGLEIIDQAQAEGIKPDAICVCCGGGGLTAGIGLAVKHAWPNIDFHTVEPSGFDDHARSFIAGKRLRNEIYGGSICDALLAEIPGKLTFPINQNHVTSGLVITDEEALSAVSYAFHTLKLVVEPGGAAALAAILSGTLETKDRTIIAVLSGGNIDPTVMARALEA